MKTHAQMHQKAALATALALALSACGGGGGGGGGVSPAGAENGNAYDEVSELTGQSRLRYLVGSVFFIEDIVYGGTTTSNNGVTYRLAESTVQSDSLSGPATLSPIACAAWDQTAAVLAPGDSAKAAAFAGSYICSFFFGSGAEAWYEIKIADNNAISGSYAFISSTSSANGLAELDSNPTAILTGTHSPSALKSAGVKEGYKIDASLHESLVEAVAPQQSDYRTASKAVYESPELQFSAAVEGFFAAN